MLLQPPQRNVAVCLPSNSRKGIQAGARKKYLYWIKLDSKDMMQSLLKLAEYGKSWAAGQASLFGIDTEWLLFYLVLNGLFLQRLSEGQSAPDGPDVDFLIMHSVLKVLILNYRGLEFGGIEDNPAETLKQLCEEKLSRPPNPVSSFLSFLLKVCLCSLGSYSNFSSPSPARIISARDVLMTRIFWQGSASIALHNSHNHLHVLARA